ncbi:MAG: hypothetical protein IJ447_07710 [Clostridia bacterium]|nr:hypothetical protein [Clostridia bacterium]
MSDCGNKNIKYFLGIDGGGSKTEFLLTDTAKKEIRRIVLGSSNPVNMGIDNAFSVLKKGIEEVCDGINLGEVSAFAGIAGSMNSENKNQINNFLSQFGFGFYNNGSDVENALETALGTSDGVAVIMGTGIVAFSRVDTELHRVGGWGYLIDKGGSGFALGSAALNSAFSFFDGRGGSELIFTLAEKKLGKPLNDSIAYIYSRGLTFVASFASVLFEAYKKGDSEAAKILEQNLEETARIISSAAKHLNGDKKIVLCGGLCNQAEIIEPIIKKHLNEEYNLIFSTEPMVNGAISLAERGAEYA